MEDRPLNIPFAQAAHRSTVVPAGTLRTIGVLAVLQVYLVILPLDLVGLSILGNLILVDAIKKGASNFSSASISQYYTIERHPKQNGGLGPGPAGWCGKWFFCCSVWGAGDAQMNAQKTTLHTGYTCSKSTILEIDV